ncbi:MAG: glycoside hydrolase family 43 protein [candidate division KSB1 bacterium]|nr:glycoside hydrolase family 43 protein [candidate division KSB1 bacterium]
MRIGLILTLFAVACLWLACNEETPFTARNPVLPGFHPDPSICRVGDDYYLVHSTFEYFPGIPVYHSRDLIHWRLIGHVLTRRSQLNLDGVRASGGIYAPTIRYHERTFYVVSTCVDCGGNFYVTAKDPAGPWSDPVWLDKEGIDPSLFFDVDGSVYYCRQEGGRHGYIVQRTLNLKTGRLEGEPRKLWEGTGGIWPEGPHLYRIGATYYLMISEGGTSYEHCVTMARSDSPWGPFQPHPKNPILTHRALPEHPIQATGHADLVETPDGWWLVCLGIRPQGGRFHHIGRETFLARVAFDQEGWAEVGTNGTIDSIFAPPRLRPHAWKSLPARVDFEEPTLDLRWNFVRNPDSANYSLAARPGFLRLYGAATRLTDRASPTFVGMRQTDFACRVTSRLEFDPKAGNEEAGLVVRQTDKYHYEIFVTRRAGKREVGFRRVVDNETLEPIVFEEIPAGPVTLQIEAEPLLYRFSCVLHNGKKIVLGEGVTRDLSVERIGFKDGMCFTGAYVGLYATGNGRACSAPADFDWFEYQGFDQKN